MQAPGRADGADGCRALTAGIPMHTMLAALRPGASGKGVAVLKADENVIDVNPEATKQAYQEAVQAAAKAADFDEENREEQKS